MTLDPHTKQLADVFVGICVRELIARRLGKDKARTVLTKTYGLEGMYQMVMKPDEISRIRGTAEEACEREISLDRATALKDAIEAIDETATRYDKLLDDAPAVSKQRRRKSRVRENL